MNKQCLNCGGFIGEDGHCIICGSVWSESDEKKENGYLRHEIENSQYNIYDGEKNEQGSCEKDDITMAPDPRRLPKYLKAIIALASAAIIIGIGIIVLGKRVKIDSNTMIESGSNESISIQADTTDETEDRAAKKPSGKEKIEKGSESKEKADLPVSDEDQNADKKDGRIAEEYDEDGKLIHYEEPCYEDGVLVGTLCYDAVIPCDFRDETYNTPSLWILPVVGPKESVERCMSFTLNMMYSSMEDPKGLGLQVIYCRENDAFQKAGYLDMPNLNENYTMDFKFETPTKIDGFALMAYTPSMAGAFSLGCVLTDVFYLK